MPAGDASLPEVVRGSPRTTADISASGRRLLTTSALMPGPLQTLSTAETLTVAEQQSSVSLGGLGLRPGPASQELEAEPLKASDLAEVVTRADADLQQALTGPLPGPAGQKLSTSALTSSMELMSAASRPGATRPGLHPAAAAQAAVLSRGVAWNETGLPQRGLLHDGALPAGQAMLPGVACKVEVVAGFPWRQHPGSWLNTISMRITNTGASACACHASGWRHIV